MADDKLSTSALARRLEMPVQQLFATLKEHNWIRKLDEGWALTSKGEFEGGSYVSSKRYGRYIVWPLSLLEHAMLKEVDGGKLLSAAALSKQLDLSPQQFNRLLVELGWLRPSQRGWQLTPQGKNLGGQSVENQHSGLVYAMWPEELCQHVAFQRLLEKCLPPLEPSDLFASVEPPLSLDGRRCESWPHWHIAQWLYLAGVRYSYCRYLPVEEALQGDFYLPDYSVYLEYWGGDELPEQLSNRLRRADIYQALAATVIDIHPEDLSQLDDYLGRRLREAGVSYY